MNMNRTDATSAAGATRMPATRYRPASPSERAPALPAAEVPAFVSRLRQVDSVGARAVEFGILTLARRGEIAAARWADIDDTDMFLWHIPGHLRATGQPRRVPLSPAAVTALCGVSRRDVLVFASAHGRPLSDLSLVQPIRSINSADDGRWTDRMGRPIVFAGFRDSFREWADEISTHGAARAKIVLGGRDADSLGRAATARMVRRVLNDWAAFCAGEAM